MIMNLKETVIGIELGSTRIKSVLLGRDHTVLASGSFTWENSLVNGIWTKWKKGFRPALRI